MKMKSKYWPFARHKWSRSRGRSETLSYELYHESITMQSLDWDDAYYCCKDDVKFLNRYGERFENRYEPTGIFRFLALALLTLLFVTVITFICCGQEITLLHLSIAIGISVVLIALEFGLRVLYYRGIEYDLIHADNRVSSLEAVWPEIMDVVNLSIAMGSTDLPFEPEKVAKSESFRVIRANLETNDEIEEPGVVDLFTGDDEGDNDVDETSTLDEVFATLVAEDEAERDEISDIADTNTTGFTTQPGTVQETTASDDVTEAVVEPDTTDDTTKTNTILELISKIDTLNKCLQEGL